MHLRSELITGILSFICHVRTKLEKNMRYSQTWYIHVDIRFIFKNTDILDRLEDLVVKDLSVENCLDYCSKAEECEMKSLQKTVIRYISWHLMELVEHEDWVKLPKSTIISLVSNDVLNIEKEEDVYEALWKWFKYDENK